MSSSAMPYYSIEFSISTVSVPTGNRGIYDIFTDDSHPPVVAMIHGMSCRETDSCGGYLVRTGPPAYRSNSAIFLFGYCTKISIKFRYGTDTAH